MNRSYFSAGALLLALIFGSCSNTADRGNDPKDVAEEHNDAKFDKAREKDAQFLVDAADADMQIVRLSELAATQAQAADIKELSQMLKEDHSSSLKEIGSMAAKKMISLPGDLSQQGQDAYRKTENSQGGSFDQDYTALMVDLYKEEIRKYEKAAQDSQDGEIKAFAQRQLEKLRTDLDRAMVCRDKYTKRDDHIAKDMRK